MNPHEPIYGKFGELFPTNFPLQRIRETSDAGGFLFRGVVFATRSFDEPRVQLPFEEPCAIYCDVLVYANKAHRRFFFLKDCLVAQESGSLHNGRVWRPKACTTKFDGRFDPNKPLSLHDLDGDHVLVGFLDGDPGQPVILKQIPHPATSNKTKLPAAVDVPGHRLTLKNSDPEVSLWRHNGSFFGLRENGAFVVDTSRAQNGLLQPDGQEIPFTDPTVVAPTNIIRMRNGSTLTIEVVSDADDPATTPKQLQFSLDSGALTLQIAGANVLQLTQSGGTASAQIGDGAKHVAIVEHLETLYNALKVRLDTFDALFAAHTHVFPATPVGAPTSPVVPVPILPQISAPAWDSDINSSKVSIPDG